MDAGDHASADFKALGLRLYPAHAPLLITYLYLKQHTAKETGGAVPGAVFVTGLPLGLDESSLRAVFGCFGDVAQVVLHATKVRDRCPGPAAAHGPRCGRAVPGAGGRAAAARASPGGAAPHTPRVRCHALQRSGVVVFSDEDGAQAALEHAGAGEIVEYELPPPEGPFGLKAWVAEHKAQRPGNAVLQKQVPAACRQAGTWLAGVHASARWFCVFFFGGGGGVRAREQRSAGRLVRVWAGCTCWC
jgi:hypothetical protein